MAGQRVSLILKSRTDLSDEQISLLSDADGWRLIYALKPPKSQLHKKTNQICFTGFSASEKDRLGQLATDDGLDVVKTVTQSLAYLVTGPNAGPAKLKKAREQDVIVMDEAQFAKFLQDGELPDSACFEYVCRSGIEEIPAMGDGIFGLPVFETPVAVLDFETTGLTAGMDRVVEVSVIRRDPDGRLETVLDTLVNPRRPMGATEIHGITDADVADAPVFEEVAPGVARAISGCVLAAYNVYFDMRFFSYEMQRAGISLDPPHMCLMYLRPLLGLGPRCSLGDACQAHSVPYTGSHVAWDDAEASAKLMEFYLSVMCDEGIRSFQDLAARGTYKFLRSFDRNISRCDSGIAGWVPKRIRSRKGHGVRPNPASTVGAAPAPTKARNGLAAYWDGLKAAVADLQIDDEELRHLSGIVQEYELRQDQVRMLHARAFASVIAQFISDQCLDDKESRKLKRLHQCLSKLGWAPGE
jgi:DNA polymerase-3 subunit epsilon